MQKLGIDIGRVLIAPDAPNGRADTSFIGGTLADALATPPYPGMFDAVPALVQRFEGQVWLVSKAGPRGSRENPALVASPPLLRTNRRPA
jgi:hypothetical protein